jgi:hypothetical protein
MRRARRIALGSVLLLAAGLVIAFGIIESSLVKERARRYAVEEANRWRAVVTRDRSISIPMPYAPYLLAAVITIRPSPEPRSYTVSWLVTPANVNSRSTTSCGIGTIGNTPETATDPNRGINLE